MKTVLTCGVYDVLHIGHINLLHKAKNLGDYLVVGIKKDEAVIKNKQKPVLTTREREMQMEALGIADKVIIYNEVTPSFLKKVDLNIFVHGKDWESQRSRKDVKEYMRKNGIKLVLLPRTEGISSTDVKNRIVESSKAENYA